MKFFRIFRFFFNFLAHSGILGKSYNYWPPVPRRGRLLSKTISEFMNKNLKTPAYITPLAKDLRNNMTGSENKDKLNNIEFVEEMIKRKLLEKGHSDWCPLRGIGG